MKNIEKKHCKSCGETSSEYIGGPEREGYSDCCNKRVVYTQGYSAFGGKPTTCETNDDCTHE